MFAYASCYLSRNHFEWDGHAVHMPTQWHLLPPLTSTVKSLLFTHEHSSPLSLAARSIDVFQTFIITLTMAGLFPDRPRIYTSSFIYLKKINMANCLCLP